MHLGISLLKNYLSFTVLFFKNISAKKRRGFVNHTLLNAKYLLEVYSKKNYIFIHINKTGGSSIANAIGDKQQIHFSAYALKNYLGTKVFNSKFKFAFVRNPYDRIVSQYHYRLQNNQTDVKSKNISFKDWVKACFVDQDEAFYNYPAMFQSQVDWLTDTEEKLLVDFVGKFENMENDFLYVCDKLNNINSTLPHHRKSIRSKDYMEYYDEETLEIITNAFEKDFRFFGYEKLKKLPKSN